LPGHLSFHAFWDKPPCDLDAIEQRWRSWRDCCRRLKETPQAPISSADDALVRALRSRYGVLLGLLEILEQKALHDNESTVQGVVCEPDHPTVPAPRNPESDHDPNQILVELENVPNDFMAGRVVHLLDGEKKLWSARIVAIDRNRLTLTGREPPATALVPEKPLSLRLYTRFDRKNHLDSILQTSVKDASLP